MSFGSSGSSNQQTVYTGLDIQTSALGVPCPIVWGLKRMGTNLIWEADFTAVRDKKGGGKGGEGKNPINNYTVAIMMALCEGPIVSIGTVWQDKTITTLSNLGLTLFLGAKGQAPWSYLLSNHPSQALTYSGTAFVADSAYNLGRQPTLPNHNYELIVNINGSGYAYPTATSGWCDVNMADVILDFLTNPQYSIGLPVSAVDPVSLTNYANYTNAQGLVFSPDITDQEQVSSILDRWASLTNSWIFWSANVLKFVPLGDSALNLETFTQVDTSVIPLSAPQSSLNNEYFGFRPRIGRGNYGVSDLGVTFQDTGVPLTFFPAGGADNPPPEGQYWFGGGDLYLFSPADAGRPIIVTYTCPLRAGGNSWTPNNTSVASLSYDDFVVGDKGTPPVEVNRADPADCYNHVKLEVIDRGNAYNTAICEWKDEGLINQYGLVDSPVTQAHEVCWPQVGNVCAALIGQRAAYIRNTYDFKLGFEYCWLEPGDIVDLTESHIGLNGFPVRIRTLDEDDNGNWAVVAEEFPGGIGTVLAGGTPSTTAPISNPISTSGAPPNVNPPGVFEPVSTLTNGIPELWVAASGGENWGGCLVYVSFDNINFSSVGAITSPSLQAVSTADLPNHADPDTVDTLSLNTQECDLAFPTDVSEADANAYRTLSLLTASFTNVCPNNGELIAYGEATTTGEYTANLQYLRRGLYNTPRADHPTGSFFTRFNLSQVGQPVGNSWLQYDLPPQYIGQTIYLKFPSFNLFGNQPQSLADVQTYTYQPTGAGYGGGSGGVPTVPTGLAVVNAAGGNIVTWSANPTTDNVVGYLIFRANGAGAAFSAASQIGQSLNLNYVDTAIAASTSYTYFLEAYNVVGPSAPTAGVSVTTGTTGSSLFRLSGNLAGAPTASQLLFEVEMVGGETFPAGLTGSLGGADTAPTGSITCEIAQNGVSIGSMNIAASATSATFTFAAPITFSSGDRMQFYAPATVDATLSDLYYTFIGSG